MTDPSKSASENEEIMRHSKDGRELQQAAVAYAQDKAQDSHAFLRGFLVDEEFLGRLDTAESYNSTFNSLRLARVIRNLMDNRVPGTDSLLLSLATSAPYQSNALRVQLLIRALAVIQPSPAPAIEYWTKYSSTGGVLVYDVVEALCDNCSAPAIGLLEGMFMSGTHDHHEMQSWLREIILPKRTTPALVMMCERLVCEMLDPTRGLDLLEALFDYKPENWYIECEPPTPPAWLPLEDEIKASLGRTGRFGLGLAELPSSLREEICTVLEELGEEAS